MGATSFFPAYFYPQKLELLWGILELGVSEKKQRNNSEISNYSLKLKNVCFSVQTVCETS